MKCIVFTVLACLAITAEPHPFFGINIAAGIGEGLGKAVGTGVALGLGTAAKIGAGAIGLGAGVIDGVANGVENGLGLRGLAGNAARNVEQGSSRGITQNDAAEAGAYSEEAHKKSESNYHDRAHHHSTVTTITRVENSDEHDVGGHQAVEESAHDAGAFQKQASAAAKNSDSNYEGDSQDEADE